MTRGDIIALSISALLGIAIYSIIDSILECFFFHSPNYDGGSKFQHIFPTCIFIGHLCCYLPLVLLPFAVNIG